MSDYGIGIFQDDLILYTGIVSALEDIKKNPYYIEDIANQILTDPLTDKKYGRSEVDKFKLFLKKKFYVNIAHRIEEAKFPAISISLGSGSEDRAKAALGDSFDKRMVAPDTLGGSISAAPTIIAGPSTPKTFDKLTGSMSFGDDVNLDSVYPGMVVFDEVNNNAYPIDLVLDGSNLIVILQPGDNPTLTGCTIRPESENYVQIRKSLFFLNNYTIGCHATDSTELMYLFQIMMFVFLKYKQTLFEARGFEITTLSYGEIERFEPAGGNDPNVIWERKIQLSGRIGMSWPDNTNRGIQGVAADIRVDTMKSPDGILPVVDLQGWRGSEDE